MHSTGRTSSDFGISDIDPKATSDLMPADYAIFIYSIDRFPLFSVQPLKKDTTTDPAKVNPITSTETTHQNFAVLHVNK